MIVLCAGMYRSGSTWQYQVACDLLGRGYPRVQKLGFMDGAAFETFRTQNPPADVHYILKTHEAHPAFEVVMQETGTICLYSYRDLRDVVYSMADKIAGDFRTAIEGWGILDRALANYDFWIRFPRRVVQQYEQWLQDECPAIRAIADILSVPVTTADVEAIRDWYSLARNKERTQNMTDILVKQGVDLQSPTNALRNDPETLLHWNHIRDGQIGGWRARATPEELRSLEDRCGPWLTAHGYR